MNCLFRVEFHKDGTAEAAPSRGNRSARKCAVRDGPIQVSGREEKWKEGDSCTAMATEVRCSEMRYVEVWEEGEPGT